MNAILSGGISALLLTCFFWFVPVLPFPVHQNGILVFLTTGISGLFAGGVYTVTRAVRNRTGLSQFAGVLLTWLAMITLYAFAFHAGLGHFN